MSKRKQNKNRVVISGHGDPWPPTLVLVACVAAKDGPSGSEYWLCIRHRLDMGRGNVCGIDDVLFMRKRKRSLLRIPPVLVPSGHRLGMATT
jgi:hypothetical protein